MRIIGGNKSGIRINIPKNLKLRPTTDRSKEALFNILYNNYDFTKVSVLDLFGGSGNISYEFSSRGTEKICLVEKNKKSIDFIKSYSKTNDFKIKVIKSDAFSFLKKEKMKYDIIFADPPYDLSISKYELIINTIFGNQMLNINGSLIIEHFSKLSLHNSSNFSNSRKYGDTSFTFFNL